MTVAKLSFRKFFSQALFVPTRYASNADADHAISIRPRSGATPSKNDTVRPPCHDKIPSRPVMIIPCPMRQPGVCKGIPYG